MDSKIAYQMGFQKQWSTYLPKIPAWWLYTSTDQKENEEKNTNGKKIEIWWLK